MPELPEVETVRRSLARHIAGREIMAVRVFLPRLVKWPESDLFCARLTGRTIREIDRTGKYLRLRLDDAAEFIVHLKMTGELMFSADGSSEGMGFVRAEVRFRDGAALFFGDARTLGALYALRPEELPRLASMMAMGPEPLTEAFCPAYLYEIARGHRAKLKSFLLNQKYIGGLGNIYADEALFRARLRPGRPASSLSRAETERLHEAINEVIREGIDDGGTTIRNYRDGEGHVGLHQDKLRVYQRTGAPCPVCGTPIKRVVIGGRGTHYCPKCQK